MRQIAPLVVALMMAGCGGDKEMPAANSAQPQASARIIAGAEAANQVAENVPEAVSRETVAEQPEPSSGPDRRAEDRYRAIGTEPFWAVTVKGSPATLERPDQAPVRYAVSRHDDKRSIRYLGNGFAMTVTEGPCRDGMSDAVWSDRVAVAFGEGTLKGCGGIRDDQGEP